MLLALIQSERIGAGYLGYLIPLLTFLLALGSVIALYRRFAKQGKSE